MKKKTLKLVWIDEKIGNYENKTYQKRLQELSIDTHFFNQNLDAQQFIKTNEQNFDLVMVVSGALLYKLDPTLKGYFICFCGNSKFHYQKFLDLKQLIVLIDSGFDELQLVVKQYIIFLKSKQILHLSFCPSYVQQAHYSHSIEEISFKFLLVIAKLKQNINITEKQEILEEMLDLDLKKMVNETQLKYMKEMVNNYQFSVLEKLMFYYSTEYIYAKLNQHFAEQNYDQIQNIILVLFDGFSKLKYTQAVPKLLYRGIKLDQKNWNNIINDLLNCEKNQSYMFWNALTSVSSDISVAQRFTQNNYGIVFEIELSQQNPHPYFYFNNCNSYYFEQEILLFPQFGFQVQKNNRDGNFLTCQIKQIKNNFAMAFNQDKREQYWNQRIENEIQPNLEEVLKFNLTRVYSVINLLCNSNELNNKSLILRDEVILCFKNLIQQFQEYYPDYSQFNSLLKSFISVIEKRMNFQFPIDQSSVKPLYEFINAAIQNFQDEFIKLIKRLFNFQQDNLIRNIRGYSIKDGLQRLGSYNSKYKDKQFEPVKYNNVSGESRIILLGDGYQKYKLFQKICNLPHLNSKFSIVVGKSIFNNIEVINPFRKTFCEHQDLVELHKALSLGKLNQIFVVFNQERYVFILQQLHKIIDIFKQYINLITLIICQNQDFSHDFNNFCQDLPKQVSKYYGNMKFIFILEEDSPINIILKIQNVFQPEIQYDVKLSEDLIFEELVITNESFDNPLFEGLQINLHKIRLSVRKFFEQLKSTKFEDINNILFDFRNYVFDVISTAIVEWMNNNEEKIDKALSEYGYTDDKYLALWNALYKINSDFKQEYENIHRKISRLKYNNSDFSKNIKACPYCGLIWLKVSDCNGLSNCGEFPSTEANYVEKFLHQLYTFTMDNDTISFKKSEEQFKGKQYKQPEEKQYKEPQKRVGCGMYFDWDSLPPFDNDIIFEQLFSFNIEQFEYEQEQHIWKIQNQCDFLLKCKQDFQNQIQNLIRNERVDYL